MTTFCKIKRLTPTARMPERGSSMAAGMDVRADFFDERNAPRLLKTSKTTSASPKPMREDGLLALGYTLHPGQRVLVPTGLSMRTSADIYVRVAPRSGLALGDGIDCLAGVVDADYPGEVGVLLINTDAEKPFVIHHGMRIAQLVLEKVSLVSPEEVDDFDEHTDRGAAGFGTTGVT